MQENNNKNFDNFDNLPTLGDKLRRMRKHAGLTQSQMGQKIGVKDTHISKWETNRSKPSRDYIIKVAKLFDVSLDTLEKHIQEKPISDVSVEEKIQRYNSEVAGQQLSDSELDLLISFLRDHAKSLLKGLDVLEELENRRRRSGNS